jgi:hypothetical protein
VSKALVALLVVLGIVIFKGYVVGWAQADPFLAVYYDDNRAVSCRDYGTANGARFATYQWWLLGFVSGAGYERTAMKLPMTKTDAADALEWASNYCKGHPQDTLASAGVALVARLGSARSAR